MPAAGLPGSMRIYQVRTENDRRHVKELFTEYLAWLDSTFRQEFGYSFDVGSKVEEDWAALDQFSPPEGRLMLAEENDRIAGLAALRKIGEDLGEIKRMYVRPAFRGRGIGGALLKALLTEARQIGYARLRLDSARFTKAAQAMYHAAGFMETAPYSRSEVPQEWRSNWVFMERPL